MRFNIDAVRAQFPSLSPPDRPVPVYFDNPGGTQTPQSVIDAVSNYYLGSNANSGGTFETSRRTDRIIDHSRRAVAALLNAAEPETIIFGNNMTSLTFHLARSIADTIRPGDEIVVTDLDHDANVAPWLDLEANGAVIRYARMDASDCSLSVEAVAAEFSARTRLVAVTQASNAVGTIPDVAGIISAAHRVGAQVFVDAVQYAPHRLVDVQALDCDFLACSSYKFFGPHAGVLYGKRERLEQYKPHKVRPAPAALPHCWETGTQNHEAIAGIGAAIRYLANAEAGGPQSYDGDLRASLAGSMLRMEAYEEGLCRRLIVGLQQIDDLTIYGITDPDRMHERLCTVAFTSEKYAPGTIAKHLGEQGIYCWSGNYYALSLMQRLGLEGRGGAVRIGPAHYNTPAEIDRLLEELTGLLKSG